MKNRNVADLCKNAVGTVFLLAGAFFVCSTLLSMRAVLADPIAPTDAATAGAMRGDGVMRSGRASPRNTSANRNTNVARPATTARSVSARPSVVNNANRTTSASRGVVARTATNGGARATKSRGVTARTATATVASPERVSIQGSAIRGSRAIVGTNSNLTSYTYLSNKLYTGNYSNIIDSSTGLISADAYSTCLESYYTCMDEICTARSSAKRRCSCAARVTNFMEAEEALKSANEELIKASGELALLLANKGKDVSDAFQLTDAEKVMNCVSWQETTGKYGVNSQQAKDWCSSHNIFASGGGEISSCAKPAYCSKNGNNFGFDIANIEGSSSDILASLQAWADAKNKSMSYVADDKDNLLSAFANVSIIVSDLAGISTKSDTTIDNLAQTWGYDLFEYAHNNVCSRVLDSCFNGIYEGCGTPPSGGKCANGATGSCPFNYNSKITVSSSGDVVLNERGTTSVTSSTYATCLGYTATTGDPYGTLRGPVADARRSIMQKYLLDANADCDTYGEELKTLAQNISYQKIAAQQALQQKRLEFANNERDTIRNNALAAITNFNECIGELLDCYETQAQSYSNWPDARIKTYCAQIANVPHCYEQMICYPSTATFYAVIDKADSTNCSNSQDYTKNTCRNIVSLSEILSGVVGAVSGYQITYNEPETNVSGHYTGNSDSASIREACLQQAGISEIRNWTRSTGE